MNASRAWIVAGLLALGAPARAQTGPAPQAIPIPGGESGIGFDDLRYSSALRRVLVPAGGAGSLVLLEPGNWKLTQIGGLGVQKDFSGGHGDGVTSADEGRGFLFA